uniref:Uncharacterized protein n=1 Tax=Rhizophora mucronata TaxID=61149 RepID=A0A2P2NVZ0_RHIMU
MNNYGVCKKLLIDF